MKLHSFGILSLLVSAVAIVFLLQSVSLEIVRVQGKSMEPVLHQGEVLWVNRLAYGFHIPFSQRYLFQWKTPSSGEIVLFSISGRMYVKRCLRVIEEKNKKYVYVVGDNPEKSIDSRMFGPIPVRAIHGRVFTIFRKEIGEKNAPVG
ncbi:MAG: S26 family signal peptidase [Spirochaetales bacterium]|nr:S26 family signal peptidase [Spirochaetales bacterium]MCF7939139.1 S26 family signal peptidase [Spirochaetales bacterium]